MSIRFVCDKDDPLLAKYYEQRFGHQFSLDVADTAG